MDVQATVGLMGSKLGGGPSMTLKYHQSLESSVQQSFPGNHCINCMCHSTENLYRYVALAHGRHACLTTRTDQYPKAEYWAIVYCFSAAARRRRPASLLTCSRMGIRRATCTCASVISFNG